MIDGIFYRNVGEIIKKKISTPSTLKNKVTQIKKIRKIILMEKLNKYIHPDL